LTILQKRENFRKAFDGFDPYIVSKYTEDDVLRILGNAGVVRHRGKIEAAISNAKAWIEIEENYEGGFSKYLWDYVGGSPLQPNPKSNADVPAQTELSQEVSKNLKKRGFKFCGPTIVYAFMQAVGMINDHLTTCYRHAEVKQMVRAGVDEGQSN